MAYSLTWLPQVLQNAGLKIALCDGWENRGHSEMGEVLGVICHYTAGVKQGNMPSLDTLIKGRLDPEEYLPGPLAQLGLGRDGTFYIVAAGLCYHAGKGSWKGITSGNTHFIGIEAENTGAHDDLPWPVVQMDAYKRGVAAILQYIKQPDVTYCAGHKEYALPPGRKTDPDFDMDVFRAGVSAIMQGAVPPHLIPSAEPSGQLRPTLRRGQNNNPDLVKTVQTKVGVTADGVFGPGTEAAIRLFQQGNNIVPDGIVGPKTWALI